MGPLQMLDATNQNVITSLANALAPKIPEWYGMGAALQADRDRDDRGDRRHHAGSR